MSTPHNGGYLGQIVPTWYWFKHRQFLSLPLLENFMVLETVGTLSVAGSFSFICADYIFAYIDLTGIIPPSFYLLPLLENCTYLLSIVALRFERCFSLNGTRLFVLSTFLLYSYSYLCTKTASSCYPLQF